MVRNAHQYGFPNNEMMQMDKDENGSDVIVVHHGIHIIMVSTQTRLACRWNDFQGVPGSLAVQPACPGRLE